MKKEIEIKSDKDALSKAEIFLSDFKKEFVPNLGDRFFNILIAYTEAINNAVNHGNIKNPSKSVKIKLEIIDNQSLEISVQDQGEGFEEKKIPDPTLPENLYKDSGRGVFLIKKLADGVDYKINSYGTLVRMKFDI